MTLTRQVLDPASETLPCDCLTSRMKLARKLRDPMDSFCRDYKIGDTVLVDTDQIRNLPTSSDLLEPFIIRTIDRVVKRISLSRLIRKRSIIPTAPVNELLLTNVTIHVSSFNIRLVILRRFDLWHIPNATLHGLPNHLLLNGSGEQFWIQHKICQKTSLNTDFPSTPALLDMVSEDLKAINLSSDQLSVPSLRGLDIFCGAGNLGEGIRDCGVVRYSSVVDLLPEALHSYRANHTHRKGDDLSVNTEFYLGSVNRFLERDIKRDPESMPKIDFIVAGSPCQGFSAVNLRKNTLQSLRNCSLIASFASYLDFYRPKYAVLENVAGLAENVRLPDGQIVNVHRQLLAVAVGLGYQVRTYSNHAWMHGAAQSRTRIFVIFAEAGLTLPKPPIQDHYHPVGHTKMEKLRGPHNHVYHNIMSDDSEIKSFPTRLLKDIWEDLPDIGDGRRICITHPDHQLQARPSYFENMTCRSFGGYAPGVKTKTSRSLRSNQRYIRHARTASEVHSTGGVPAALVESFPVVFEPASKAFGRSKKISTCLLSVTTRSLIRAADPDRLIGTILCNPAPRAKLGSPCIHYVQPRRHTILEAKRAQGFLDHDVLLGTTAMMMKQVGNSVSRHVSFAIGLTIRNAMLKDWEIMQMKAVQIASVDVVSGNGSESDDIAHPASTIPNDVQGSGVAKENKVATGDSDAMRAARDTVDKRPARHRAFVVQIPSNTTKASTVIKVSKRPRKRKIVIELSSDEE